MSKNYDHFYKSLEDVAKRLRLNLDSERPSIAPEIVWAYQNETVLKALATRLATGERLESVDILIPDIVLELRRVYFRFAPLYGFDTELGGILVEVGGDNEVVRIVEPFQLTREHHSLLTLQEDGAFPLVIGPPLFPTDEETDSAEQRFKAFIISEGLEDAFDSLITVGVGGTTTTWKNVKTATLDKNGRHDTQTDQRGTQDPKAAAIFRNFRVDPKAIFPGSPEESRRE